MSILRELPEKMGFEAGLMQSSKSYQNVSKIAQDSFEAFTKAECEGKTISETFEFIKALPEAKREPTLYHVLQSWINKLCETRDTTTAKNYFGVIKKLARYYGFKISKDDVKERLKFPKKIKDRKYVLTIDDINLILKGSNWNKKGFYLFLLSTGMRPKEALSIRKKHVTQLGNGMYMITIPAEATKLKIEREAFVSREVYPYLAKMLREKEYNDLIWTGQENTDFAVITAGTTFRDLCDRIGFTQRYENVNRRKLNLYCFRGFFYAKASRKHGDEYAHKMIGHEGYLPVYDRKTIDERIEMYKEFENELIIDQTHKLKLENDILKQNQDKINFVYDLFKDLETEGALSIDDDKFKKMLQLIKKKK